MNADTRIASMPSCASAIHGRLATWRSDARYSTLSAYVRPIRKKNGSIGNAPGRLIWTRIADPSRTVLTTTRTVMSVERRDLRSMVLPVRPPSTIHQPLTSQLADQAEDRHIHRDDDAADDAAEERDHQRLHERQQARDGDVHFFLVEIGDLA